MKYAVIKAGGKQYKVCEGDIVLVDRINSQTESKFDFPEVLLVRSDKATFVGDPYVSGGKVLGKILKETKGEKVTIAKFKAKVRYRKKKGFRPIYSKVLIESITEPASKVKKT